MSYIGVPFIRSAPETVITSPKPSRCSIRTNFTQESARLFGRYGERVAKTPTRSLPPSLGGRTVGDQSLLRASEKLQISQICEKSLIPLKASETRYSGVKTISERSEFANPLCLGTPNFVLRSLCMYAIGFIVYSSIKAPLF